ncbi:MAG: response regulator [Candidatus Omnitrophica bacterium]|nr:response regulator [Candidatus Omnitrophota bacterium]
MAKKILIVDDDPDFVEATSNVLVAEKFDVVSATNGAEGFTKAKAEKPDLILLDVMMTHKTEGFDIARSLKTDQTTCQIPVIIITGIRKDMNLPFGFEPDEDWLPVKAVLEKPVKPDALLATIRKIIGE